MVGNKVQVGSDGKVRVEPSGKVVVAADDSGCCCCPCSQCDSDVFGTLSVSFAGISMFDCLSNPLNSALTTWSNNGQQNSVFCLLSFMGTTKECDFQGLFDAGTFTSICSFTGTHACRLLVKVGITCDGSSGNASIILQVDVDDNGTFLIALPIFDPTGGPVTPWDGSCGTVVSANNLPTSFDPAYGIGGTATMDFGAHC